MADTYKVGDIVFFALPTTTAGEGMFIGRVKTSPDDLVLVIGKQMVEMWDNYCTPTKRGFPAEGESWRRGYPVRDWPQRTGPLPPFSSIGG